MARLIDRLFPSSSVGEQRQDVSQVSTLFDARPEPVMLDYESYAKYGYGENGPVYAAIQARATALSEVEFAWLTPDGELLPGPEVLRRPWVGGTSGQLVTGIEVHQSLAGAAYVRRTPDGMLELLRPDWLQIVGGVAQNHLTESVLGYWYHHGGIGRSDPVLIPANEVAAVVPMPNPRSKSPVVGQSWISSVAREVDGDTLMSKHKNKFYVNAATPSVAVVATQSLTDEQRKLMRDTFTAKYESWENAYKTVFLEGAADIKVIGSQLDQLSFSQVQGAGETRIASASGVPAVLLGFAEGLQAATYSNYQQAMRRFADLTCRPLWRAMCDGLSPIVGAPPVPGARLWYDDRRVSFLQQDAKDAAEIRKEDALTIESLIRGGFTPDSAKQAVTSGKFDDLQHTGLVSVQLQPPGTAAPALPEGTSDD